MVDYTRPAMRDESYRRWKGGQKLANELRLFYTSKARLDQIAASNPMAPKETACKGCKNRRDAIRRAWNQTRKRGRDGFDVIRRRVQPKPKAPAPHLPGRDAPTR